MRQPRGSGRPLVTKVSGNRTSGYQRSMSVALILVALATLAVLPVTSVQLSAETSFLPAMLTLVGCFDLLSALFLLRQYLDTGDRVSLRLSWAYLFSLVVLAGYGASFPGVLGTHPPLDLYPSTSPWLWVTWHTGFPVLLAVALTSKCAPSQDPAPLELRRRALWTSIVFCSGAGALCVSIASVLGGHLPVLIHGDDYSAMTRIVGPVMLPLVTIATRSDMSWLL